MMTEQEQTPKPEQPKNPTAQELYGSQGNQGEYGQGQYDSTGKPDTNGVQTQDIIPELQDKLAKQQPLNAETKEARSAEG